MSSKEPDTIAPSRANARYSAKVRISLHANGQIYPVAQIGGGRLIFDSPVAFPQTTGTVVMTVDGQEERWHVAIPHQPEPTRIIAAELKPG
jgi:hypothetical protein